MEGGKQECPEKNPRSKDENQQQTQLTYDTGTGNRTWATLVEGDCQLTQTAFRWREAYLGLIFPGEGGLQYERDGAARGNLELKP